MGKSLAEIVAEIVLAQSERRDLDAEEIARISIETARAFKVIQQMEKGAQIQVESLFPALETPQEPVQELPAATEEPKQPIMPPEESIGYDKIVCLECGEKFDQLSWKHLETHGLTSEEYREKWGFKKRQPLTSKAASAKRGDRVRKSGLAERMQAGRKYKRGQEEQKQIEDQSGQTAEE